MVAQPPSRPEVIDQFISMYQSLSKDNLDRLSTVYREDIHFIDALHEVKGLPALTDYFRSIYSNVTSSHFHIHHVSHCDGNAWISWRMEYTHPKLNGGKTVSVEGASHLQYDEKIHTHRDYLDMGQMLYEHIPLLGRVIQWIKKRASA